MCRLSHQTNASKNPALLVDCGAEPGGMEGAPGDLESQWSLMSPVSDVSGPVEDQREERVRAVVCDGSSLPATHVLVTSLQCGRGEDGRWANLRHLRVLGDRGGVEEVGAALFLPHACQGVELW